MRMSLHCVRPFVALACFTIGVLSVTTIQYWSAFDVLKLEPISREKFVREISVCDLGEPSGKFVGKRISANALVYYVSWSNDEHSEDFIFVYPLMPPGCSGVEPFDSFILTELDLQGYSGPHSNLKFALGPFEREVDVRILGTVEKVERIDSCVKYKIKAEEIEVLSPWREFTPKAAA